MKTTKKLMFTLLAGATLGLASPVFADSYRHDRGYDRHFDRHFDRHAYRGHYEYRGYAHRPVIIERPYYAARPVIVEQPVFYSQPAPAMGPGAAIGAAIGTIIDYTR
jgi:hypothetical protein